LFTQYLYLFSVGITYTGKVCGYNINIINIQEYITFSMSLVQFQ